MEHFLLQIDEGIEVEKYINDQILLTQTDERNGNESEICFHVSTLDDLISTMEKVRLEIEKFPEAGFPTDSSEMPPKLD